MMTNHQGYRDIIDFWGTTLQQVTLDEDVKTLLPNETGLFLESVGLPTDEILFEKTLHYLDSTIQIRSIIGSLDDNDVKKVGFYPVFTPDNFQMITFGRKSYVWIGKVGEAKIALEIGTGQVYSIIGKRPSHIPPELPFHSMLFVNSTIQQCLRFTQLYLQFQNLMIEPMQDDYQAQLKKDWELSAQIRERMLSMIDSLKDKFLSIDGKTMSAPDSWWNNYLEEMRAYA